MHTVARLSLRGSQTQSWKPAVDVEPLPLVVSGNEEGGSGPRASHAFWQHSRTPRKIPLLLPKAKRWDSAPPSPRGSSPEDPFAGLVQDRLASASPLPRPQAQHAARAAQLYWPVPRVARASKG